MVEYSATRSVEFYIQNYDQLKVAHVRHQKQADAFRFDYRLLLELLGYVTPEDFRKAVAVSEAYVSKTEAAEKTA
jgi:hypothetical protein